MKRDTFIFYRSFYEAIISLPMENQCVMFKAIADYSLDGNEVELTGMNKVVWTLIKPQLDANLKRFVNGQKGAKYGAKGGRPKSVNGEKNPIGVIDENPTGVFLKTPNNNNNVNNNKNNNVNNNNKEIDSDKPNIVAEKIDYDGLLTFFNQNFGKQTRVFPDHIKKKYVLLLKKGYSKEDIIIAMRNAASDEFHISNGYKHCTLEFFSRPDKIEKFSTMLEPQQEKKEYGEYSLRKSFS